MNWLGVLAAVAIICLFFCIAKKGGCCGMKKEGQDKEKKT